eukprot:255675-Pelagomonas_calceolata.AAC.5
MNACARPVLPQKHCHNSPMQSGFLLTIVPTEHASSNPHGSKYKNACTSIASWLEMQGTLIPSWFYFKAMPTNEHLPQEKPATPIEGMLLQCLSCCHPYIPYPFPLPGCRNRDVIATRTWGPSDAALTTPLPASPQKKGSPVNTGLFSTTMEGDEMAQSGMHRLNGSLGASNGSGEHAHPNVALAHAADTTVMPPLRSIELGKVVACARAAHTTVMPPLRSIELGMRICGFCTCGIRRCDAPAQVNRARWVNERSVKGGAIALLFKMGVGKESWTQCVKGMVHSKMQG